MVETAQKAEKADSPAQPAQPAQPAAPTYDAAFVNALANDLFERKLPKLQGVSEIVDITKGASQVSTVSSYTEGGLIGEFTNPKDNRNWRVMGIRPRRDMDGLITEYRVIRMNGKIPVNNGDEYDEVACREHREHVMKVCRKDDKPSHNQFYHEYQIIEELRRKYTNFRQSRHVPQLFGIGRFEEMCFRTGVSYNRTYHKVVMQVPRPFFIQERLEPSLETVMKMTKSGDFNCATAAYIAIGMCKALRLLHSIGYCHRRVMPSIFAMRLPIDQMIVRNEAELANYVALTEFSTCRRYKQLKPRKIAPFFGTLKYSSVNAMEMYEQTSIDDIVSVFFILYEMIVGKLPWNTSLDKKVIIQEKKTLYGMSQIVDKDGETVVDGYSKLYTNLFACNGFTKNIDYEELYLQLRDMTDKASLDFTLFGIRRDVMKGYIKDNTGLLKKKGKKGKEEGNKKKEGEENSLEYKT